MRKKLLLCTVSVLLAILSYNLLQRLPSLEADNWWVLLINAFILNLYITGVFALSGFALPTHKLLPAAYYEVKNPQKLRKIYKQFKVNTFRKMLLATFWKSKEQRKQYFNGKVEGIAHFEEQAQKAEFGHLIPFIILIIVSVYAVVMGAIKLGILTFVINWIGNWYPIILQRFHRMRIQLLKKRMQRRQKT